MSERKAVIGELPTRGHHMA